MSAGQAPIDCHVHVLDPERFPYAPDTAYRPAGAETGSREQLGRLLDAHGIAQALIVGPNSGYGLDNRCLLDALAHGGGRYKGVAVVRNDASRAELQDLQAAGIVGAAFNAALLGVDFYRDIAPLLERLRELGLWAQMQVERDQLAALAPMLLDSGARLLFDQKEYPAALISARAAVKSGYGDNWLRAVALEAKILTAMGLKDEAVKSLDAALGEAAAPKSAAVRTHRYLTELRRLRAEL